MSNSLYELNNEYFNILSEIEIDEETGEVLNEEKLHELLDLKQNINEKLENISLYIKNLDAEAKAINNEQKNLDKRKKQKQKRADWLRNYLIEQMQRLGQKDFETAKTRLRVSTRPKTFIDDESLIPKEYFNEKTTYTVSLSKIKEAIENGETVAGARLIDNPSINIK